MMINRKDNDREDFMARGADYLQEELESAVSFAISLQDSKTLRNVEILSDHLVADRDLHRSVKKQIHKYRKNFRKILLATASFVEDKKFETVEQAVQKINLSRFDRGRILDLLRAQKKLSFSFQTLNVTIELFSRVNENLLYTIQQSDAATAPRAHLRLLLQNALLVYELTNLVLEFIRRYGLVGVDDIMTIRADVFRDIERGRREDERLEQRAAMASQEETKEMILRDIGNREQIRGLVVQKWEDFNHKISELQAGVQAAKEIVTDLELIRDNARNQVDLLQIVATVQLLESNLNIIKNLAHIRNFSLAPLTPEDACSLLGINVCSQVLEAEPVQEQRGIRLLRK